ncbi:MAG TPA: gamma-glutamylcyclotransferase [Candidatus Sulfotelmatobacter sp.]|nr:gamma-glutamylcyclotransferase [Candidatus Sulfotelmatobacter sp.]
MSDRDRRAESRLATYGTLSPGRVNHHELAGLQGNWRQGTVRGRLAQAGWGAALGYPALVLDPQGPPVEVFLFESPDLSDHWARLDEFEGDGYRRVITHVETPDGAVDACIYVLAVEDRPPAQHEV